ncbi:MAG TPA: carboxypeptidase regulatory-like domain-containing protein [Pyrinomonadaceae bacterium]|nr:carboxypeptidase regulatory-like domain-containing protein [Pyrinomonadaceae bacterium]
MLLRCVILLCALAVSTAAQQTTGALKGTVTDQLDSLVVGATVTLKNSNGVETSATSNSSGVYEFKRLAPGTYEMRITAPGFNVYEEKSVEINARESHTLNAQLTVAFENQEVTVDDRNISTDSDNNAGAVVLRGRDLEALPNDPQALMAALQALAGPADPEGGGPQVKVDGFSNGQVPPKEAIREVRVNNNPWSAENEFPGFGGIEIFTQPGADKWHGSASFDFNDESLNSRNPYTTFRAPYQQRAYNFNLSGPIIKKRASFSAFFGRYMSDANSVVNATTLDPVTLEQVSVNQSFVTPEKNTYGNLRGDLKINKKHTLVARVNYNVSMQDLQGIGGFSLPTRAYSGRRTNFTFQATETAMLNEKTVNETRLQWIRNRFRQSSVLNSFALNVLDSFFGGGAQVGSSSNEQERFELQNFTSWTSGNHFLKVGGRVRRARIDSISPGNFGGTYTFSGGPGPLLDENDQIVPGPGGQPQIIQVSSLERYRRTLAFQRAGMSPAAIRLLGGGATQFSIAGGDPEAEVKQWDVSFYIQDEWKVRPNFTLSPGLRYENQNNINGNSDFAPRVSFAWSPVFGKPKAAEKPAVTGPSGAAAAPAPAPPPSGPPKTVFRGAVGYFYNRISEDITLQSIRFDGIHQQQFLVTDPAVLNLFPIVPPIDLLDTFAQPQIRRIKSDDLRASRSFRAMFAVERMLPAKIKLSITYFYGRTTRLQRTVNINAPLGGTFIPGLPNSGERPLGNEAGNLFEYQATGKSIGNTLSFNLNGNVKAVSFWGGYNLNKTRNTDNGQTGAPFDAYDFSEEWARTPFGSLSFAYGGGNYQLPHGFSMNVFTIASSGQPFNITTGRDTNGDTFFSERPAFATDLNKPGVVVTPLGAFDPNPSPGQTIIPRNFGRGPGFVSVNFNVAKVFKFGPAIEPKAPPPGGPATTSASAPATPGGATAKPPAKPPVQRPYSLTFSASFNNFFNRNNEGTPIGNMSSPYFLKSASGSNTFFFGGGSGSGGNRVITLRVRLSF